MGLSYCNKFDGELEKIGIKPTINSGFDCDYLAEWINQIYPYTDNVICKDIISQFGSHIETTGNPYVDDWPNLYKYIFYRYILRHMGYGGSFIYNLQSKHTEDIWVSLYLLSYLDCGCYERKRMIDVTRCYHERCHEKLDMAKTIDNIGRKYVFLSNPSYITYDHKLLHDLTYNHYNIYYGTLCYTMSKMKFYTVSRSKTADREDVWYPYISDAIIASLEDNIHGNHAYIITLIAETSTCMSRNSKGGYHLSGKIDNIRYLEVDNLFLYIKNTYPCLESTIELSNILEEIYYQYITDIEKVHISGIKPKGFYDTIFQFE